MASSYYTKEVLKIALGQVRHVEPGHKFGTTYNMSIGATGTIWDIKDTIYPWASWNTTGTISVPAVNAGDDGKMIRIVGLDENYLPQTRDVTISSSVLTPVSGTWARVFRAYVLNIGTNVGDINVTKGGTTVLRITAGKGQTLMMVYTVPANKTLLLLKGAASIQKGADGHGEMYVRYGGESTIPFRIGHTFEVADGGSYVYDFGTPIAIPQKSDIDVRATVRTNNANITASFDFLLVNN